MEDYNQVLVTIIFYFAVVIIHNTQANPVTANPVTLGSKFRLRHTETNHFMIGININLNVLITCLLPT